MLPTLPSLLTEGGSFFRYTITVHDKLMLACPVMVYRVIIKVYCAITINSCYFQTKVFNSACVRLTQPVPCLEERRRVATFSSYYVCTKNYFVSCVSTNMNNSVKFWSISINLPNLLIDMKYGFYIFAQNSESLIHEMLFYYIFLWFFNCRNINLFFFVCNLFLVLYLYKKNLILSSTLWV